MVISDGDPGAVGTTQVMMRLGYESWAKLEEGVKYENGAMIAAVKTKRSLAIASPYIKLSSAPVSIRLV
jgi:hypothetical protein